MEEDFLKDKYMGTVKIGSKGQIVIPKEARDIFGLQPGDMLLLLADKSRGIAIQRFEMYQKFAEEVFKAQQNPVEIEEQE